MQLGLQDASRRVVPQSPGGSRYSLLLRYRPRVSSLVRFRMPAEQSSSVLLLDDDPDVVRVVSMALGSEGYSVRTAGTRSQFYRVLDECDPDLFLLDVRLPDGNGMRIARELREQSDAGIILVTGEADSIDRILGLELGADDYITKPFNIRELRARVNAVLRRITPLRRLNDRDMPGAVADGPSRIRNFHGLSLDPDARRITDSHGNEITLTTLEFEVLAALSGHCNRVLTRDQIMDHVRGPDWAAYDRSIDGLISRLRKKLFPDGSGEQRIKTVRGVGYMLSLSS